MLKHDVCLHAESIQISGVSTVGPSGTCLHLISVVYSTVYEGLALQNVLL